MGLTFSTPLSALFGFSCTRDWNTWTPSSDFMCSEKLQLLYSAWSNVNTNKFCDCLRVCDTSDYNYIIHLE